MNTVKEIRRRKGWSQKDLAEESGVGQDTISGIESGRHEPRPSTLRKLADALDVEVADFFRELVLPKAEAPSTSGQPDTRLQGERALAIADSDDFRRAVKGARTAELQQTALELASFTKGQTLENPSSREEAHQRTVAHERIAIINGELDRRGASSPVELVVRQFNDAMTPSEETLQQVHEAEKGQEAG